MRLSWPAVGWIRQTVVESAVLTTAGLVVAVLLTQRSYEAAVTIHQAAIAEAGVARIVQVARNVSARDRQAQPVRLGAIVLGPDEVRVLCRSEDARRAQEACSHVATEATRARLTLSDSARVDFASSPAQAPDHIPQFVGIALALGLVWLAFRLKLRRRAGPRIQSSDELHDFSVSRGDEPGSECESFRAPMSGAGRNGTIPGMTSVALATAFDDAELVNPMHASSARGVSSSSRPSQVVPAHRGNASQPLRTKVVYRVGANPFRPDKSVLTSETVTQLREQCDFIVAHGSALQVIRVASDVGSRYAKTQTAARLAQMLAEEHDLPVLLVEADSDAPALHKALQLEAPTGLGFSEQLQRVSVSSDNRTLSVIRVDGNLHVLIESRVSVPEALGLESFAAALAELRKNFKYLVVDGPVIDVWPDVEHLAHCTDALIMVTAAGTRAPDPLSLAARHFPEEMLLGVIAAGDWSATG